MLSPLALVAVFLFLPFLMKPIVVDDTSKVLSKYIEISASLLVKGNPTDNYEVLVSLDGKITDSLLIKKAKPFYLDLEQDQLYTIIFKKKGYEDKLVMIDTRVYSKDKKVRYYSFEFDLEMDPKVSTLKREFQEYPAAWIRYDVRTKEFEISQKYQSEVHLSNHIVQEN